MSRGGKRAGSGRKQTLSAEEADFIRRDCEQRANIFRLEQAAAIHDRKLAKLGVYWGEDGEPNPADLVPISERRAVVEYGIERPETKSIPSTLSEEARYAIDVLRTNRKAQSMITNLPRLYGNRETIIRDVARDHGVSERTVRSIWEDRREV